VEVDLALALGRRPKQLLYMGCSRSTSLGHRAVYIRLFKLTPQRLLPGPLHTGPLHRLLFTILRHFFGASLRAPCCLSVL
jgi:hypothetical protein